MKHQIHFWTNSRAAQLFIRNLLIQGFKGELMKKITRIVSMTVALNAVKV